jgi:DNA-directed RNA polymerase subunit M/transcription elongation factor TFIIS
MKKINVICKGITVNVPKKPFIDSSQYSTPKKVHCPKCGSDKIQSFVTVYAQAIIDINTDEIAEILDAEFDDPTEVEKVDCLDCEYEWRVSAVIENGVYVYKAVN